MSRAGVVCVFLQAHVTAGCTGMPENVSPVTGFDVYRSPRLLKF